MTSVKILKNTIQIRNVKYWLCLIIADMLSNKKLHPIVTKLFIEGRKINISIVFTAQSLFCFIEKY